MINSVQNLNANMALNQNISVFSQKNTDNKTRINQVNNISFKGYYEDESIWQKTKNTVIALTNDVVGLTGFNAALWFLQDAVNGKLLIGKINEHYTRGISPEDRVKLVDLAKEMKADRELHNVNMFTNAPAGKAFYTHLGGENIPANSVVVGANKHSALFHELGHAIEENKTTFYKFLQRGRGHYTALSLLLYTLLSQNKNTSNSFEDEENTGIFGKIKNFIKKSDAIIPLIAFTPELITEAKASSEGLKFLKEKKLAKEITEATYKSIKKSYITCFLTYLFVPVSIMLLDSIRNEANKIAQKHHQRKQYDINY